MDSSHVSLVAVKIPRESFDDFRCDRILSLGLNLGVVTKIIKTANNDDNLTLRVSGGGQNMVETRLVFTSIYLFARCITSLGEFPERPSLLPHRVPKPQQSERVQHSSAWLGYGTPRHSADGLRLRDPTSLRRIPAHLSGFESSGRERRHRLRQGGRRLRLFRRFGHRKCQVGPNGRRRSKGRVRRHRIEGENHAHLCASISQSVHESHAAIGAGERSDEEP